jgi:hypothetical protein
MQESTICVGVSFLRGCNRNLGDLFIMESTRGPFIHSEFFLQRGNDIRYYTALNLVERSTLVNGGGFMPSTRNKRLVPEGAWETVKFPISEKDFFSCYALVLQVLALQLPYNSQDLWQCCIKFMLPFEKDLDCDNIDSWRKSGVFCSQVCLLLLKNLSNRGVLALPWHMKRRLASVNSRGCSPNALYTMLKSP